MKAILFSIFFFQVLFCFGQDFIGKWTYLNEARKKVIIEFKSDFEYKLTIQKQRIQPVESIDGEFKNTKLRYRILGTGSPIKVDIISDYSGVTIKGIMELIDEHTIQLQINPKPDGERPKEFDLNSRNYLKATKTYEKDDVEGI